jgi:hypothetical protein
MFVHLLSSGENIDWLLRCRYFIDTKTDRYTRQYKILSHSSDRHERQAG